MFYDRANFSVRLVYNLDKSCNYQFRVHKDTSESDRVQSTHKMNKMTQNVGLLASHLKSDFV